MYLFQCEDSNAIHRTPDGRTLAAATLKIVVEEWELADDYVEAQFEIVATYDYEPADPAWDTAAHVSLCHVFPKSSTHPEVAKLLELQSYRKDAAKRLRLHAEAIEQAIADHIAGEVQNWRENRGN